MDTSKPANMSNSLDKTKSNMDKLNDKIDEIVKKFGDVLQDNVTKKTVSSVNGSSDEIAEKIGDFPSKAGHFRDAADYLYSYANLENGGGIMSKEPVIKAEKFGLTTCGKFNQRERRRKSKCTQDDKRPAAQDPVLSEIRDPGRSRDRGTSGQRDPRLL